MQTAKCRHLWGGPAAPRIAAACLLGAAAAALGAPPAVGYKHLGPESCGSSVCHGKLAAQAAGVALNEYRVWLLKDRHAQAYQGLRSPLGADIARSLKLKSALDAPLCLDCHADNISKENRGTNFRIADGVGCEACHGGSERWIKSHARRDTTHAANLQAGMNATESPAVRAQICLGCHLGTQDRIATHDLMAAGHPRLRFELDAFSTNQPAHFQMKDSDYIRRKGQTTDGGLWISGQVETARRYAALLQSDLLYPGHLVPEFALYDCYACHHPIPSGQSSAQPAKVADSGRLLLQEQSLQTLRVIAQVLDSHESVVALNGLIESLTHAGQTDAVATRAAAAQLTQWIRAHESWARPALSVSQTIALRRELVRFAASGTNDALDFLTAEQIVLGLDSLTEGAQDRARCGAALDALFDAAKSSTGFDSARFRQTAAKVQAQF
jgi:Cytochrome c554 and c-prime